LTGNLFLAGFDLKAATRRGGMAGATFKSVASRTFSTNEDETALFWEAERYRSRAYPWEHIGGVKYELDH
jgi:hypothetical protein